MTSRLDALLSSAVYKPSSQNSRRAKGQRNLFPPPPLVLRELAKPSLVIREACNVSPRTSVGSCPSEVTLNDQLHLDQKPAQDEIFKESLAELAHENKNLRQANRVLYKQNSDYSDLLQEYRTNYKELINLMSRITDSIDVLGRLNRTIWSKTRVCRHKIRRAEKEAIKNWARFVEMNKSQGLLVDEVVAGIINDNTEEITVYPYKESNNMI